jgi:hypothetical protein
MAIPNRFVSFISPQRSAGLNRTLLPPDLGHWEHAALIEALRRKVADIEALEARLAQSKAQLVALIRDIEAKPGDMDCATNARRVLSHVLGKEIEKPIATSGDVSPSSGNAKRRRSTRGR